ncbi:hypothetical protein PFICI_07084 [Pestalotiopsis fici W106-1]|uniref:J domain-containing protein n=1 Tax=Pestalotiopsis fici (strain W106-1 / CGMCC3.15140) TaxID=1229662 RepID=W3X9J3_PESFW|nr:uncharacterized protein PFICI_07084 [Pestalotiopsis fici W106-1]ETS82082.1 hypothetical protein PFICI_07084 [Pestalotiopsis fici W106-1]
MPVRCSSLPTGVRLALLNRSSTSRQHHQKQGFHTTSHLRHDAAAIDSSRNHYETLNLAPGASPAEIKKSFYSLSKTHHPDLNRADPSSSKRFMRISEAYGTLSSQEKRAKYDRDVLGLHRGVSAGHPSGSFSSTNPAGGRPATGLSRRRTAFRGPPPSFYRSGGWGAHEAKRSAAQEESTGGASSGKGRTRDHHNDGSWINENAGSAGFGFGAGGMGPGQDPFGHRGDVPHFDRESHEKTQRNTEEHRTRSWRLRMGGRDRIEIETDRGPTGMFFVIGGVLLISFMGPYFFSRSWADRGKKKGTARS